MLKPRSELLLRKGKSLDFQTLGFSREGHRRRLSIELWTELLVH
jgi:hypothetical protein